MDGVSGSRGARAPPRAGLGYAIDNVTVIRQHPLEPVVGVTVMTWILHHALTTVIVEVVN